MNIHRKLLITLLFAGTASALFGQTAPVPPMAKQIAKFDTTHGDVRVDNYYWMREKTNPEVIAHLESENRYTREMTTALESVQEKIYQEILGRLKQTDLSVPYLLGDYWYYTKTEEGKQYGIYCRKKGSLDAKEEITLDLNEIGKGHKFAGIGLYQVSDDGNLLAYSLDTTGFRQYRLYIKDLRTGETIPNDIGQVNSFVWAADGMNYFYVKEDHAKRPYRLFRSQLGQPGTVLLFEEVDELYRILVERSSDKKYIFLGSGSFTSTEVRYLPSNKPEDLFTTVLPREDDHEYDVDHRAGYFYIRTNKNAKNFRLVIAPVANPAIEQWREFIPHRMGVKLERITLFADHMVVSDRENALNKFRVYDLKTGKTKEIDFPDPVYSAFATTNVEFSATKFRFSYQSFVLPSSVYEYDMKTGKKKLLKQTEILGGYKPADYTSERIYASATDGTKIPISIVYKKGTKRNGKSPLLLYGYGSYGSSAMIGFSYQRISLLERGVIYAHAHIRGGGDLGEQWHEDGKMMKKMNTFTDFIACADHLVKEKYTSHKTMAIQGGSAGGLLIGAVLNLRPDVCKVAHLSVPFVDVLNTMLDASLPLTVSEYIEWGNPTIKAEYEYMKQYCPYTNLEAKEYPATLITTSLNDSQVMYWEPAKYTAKMRTLRTDKNPLLFKINMGAGHGGASGRYDAFKEQAFNYAFILSQLGITR